MKAKTMLYVGVLVVGSPIFMASMCSNTAGVTCPQAKTYSAEFVVAAGNELEAIAPQAPHLVQMLKDYNVTLKAIRACINSKKK